MNINIDPAEPVIVREGERHLANIRALQKALEKGSAKGIESARNRVVLSGAHAHRSVRQVCCELLEGIEAASADFVKAVFLFDESGFMDGPACVDLLRWADQLPAMHFVAPLRLAYRSKTPIYSFDQDSAIAVAQLYQELKRVGGRMIVLTSIYQQIAASVSEAGQQTAEVMAMEPDLV